MQQGKGRYRLTKRFFIIIFCVVLIYVGYSLFMQQRELKKLKAQEEQLQKELDMLVLERDKLDAILHNLDTPEFIENLIREKLGWVKKGETIYKDNSD